MQIFKFYMLKDYNQLRYKAISETSFALNIVDFNIQENHRVEMLIKEENDIDENIKMFELRKAENRIIIDFPFNRKGTFEFKILIKDEEDNIVEETATNTFVYEGIVYNEELIEGTEEFDLIQETLGQLNVIKDNIDDKIQEGLAEGSLNEIFLEFIGNKDEQFNVFYEEKTKQINDYFTETKAKLDTVIEDLDTLFDDFFEEE